MHTNVAATFKLRKKLHRLNTNGQYTIITLSQTAISIVFAMDAISVTTFFCGAAFDNPITLYIILLYYVQLLILTGAWTVDDGKQGLSPQWWPKATF